MDALRAHLLSGGVREGALACAPADQAPVPASRGATSRPSPGSACRRRTRAACGCRSRGTRRPARRRRPPSRGSRRRWPRRRHPPSPCRRPAGAPRGVHDQARRSQLVADLREGAGERVGIARVGSHAERAALAQCRRGLLAPGDRGAAPSARLEVIDDGSAQVARAERDRDPASLTGATMTRMMIAIPTPTPVIESGARFSAQKPGFARDRS